MLRRILEKKKTITAMQFHSKITIAQLENREVYMLSLNEEKLLVGRWGTKELYVYDVENGKHVQTVTCDHALNDAVWSNEGNIVFTTGDTNSVILYSINDCVPVKEEQMNKPMLLSVFKDSIFLADTDSGGVFQSADCGANWRLLFIIPDYIKGWKCWQVIKVTSQNDAISYWTREKNESTWRLRIYCQPGEEGKDVDVSDYVDLKYANMTFDGNSAVLMCDYKKNVLHIFSTSGEYQRQLHAGDGHDCLRFPWRLFVDRKKQLLYIGMGAAEVKIYSLTYAIPLSH